MADDDDDPALRELRAAWRSLPDEDPPERGLAELMAAARVRADEMAAARTPWWKRVGAVLMRPPVLALASVLVLLGGLFVVTSSHQGVSPEPTPIEAPAAPAAVGVAPVAAAEPAVPAVPGAAGAASSATGSAMDAIPAAPSAPDNGAPAQHASTAGLVAPRSPAPRSPAPSSYAPKSYAPKSYAPARVRSKPEPARHEAGPAAAPEEAPPPPPASLEQEPAAAPPPTAPSPAPVTARAGGGGAADDAADDGEATGTGQTRGPALKKGTREANPLDDDLAKCRAAAARGDCAAVQALAKRIRARDAAYYANHVESDTALAGCLSSTAK